MEDSPGEVLKKFRQGKITLGEAEKKIKCYRIEEIENLARVDVDREKIAGIPEAVFAESKDAKDVAKIAVKLAKEKGYALVTKAREEDLREIKKAGDKLISAEYNPKGKTIVVKRKNYKFRKLKNARIAVIAAGTSDIGIAEEAKTAAEVMGCEAITAYDVGIAGMHRLFSPLKSILQKKVAAIVVVAGMEGALPSVVASLVDVPVIGVPTSVGYGIGGKGVSALLSMLQSCAPGLAVVNIDNGFGAGVFAALIAKNLSERSK